VRHAVHGRTTLFEVSCQTKGNLVKGACHCERQFQNLSKGPWPMWNSYTISWRHLWPCRLSPTVPLKILRFLRFIPSLTVLLLRPCVLANKYSCRQEWPDHQDLKMERRISCSNLIVVFTFTSDESVGLVSASLAFEECWQIYVARVSAGGGICVFREIFCLFFPFVNQQLRITTDQRKRMWRVSWTADAG
jgi:hypothetical protein